MPPRARRLAPSDDAPDDDYSAPWTRHPLALLGDWGSLAPAVCSSSSLDVSRRHAHVFASHDLHAYEADCCRPDALNVGWAADVHAFELSKELASLLPLVCAEAERQAAVSRGLRVSNRGGGFHSSNTFLKQTAAKGGALGATAGLLSEALARAAACAGGGRDCVVSHSWVNVCQGDAYHGLHDHAGSLLSGVLYCQLPEQVPLSGGGGGGGELVLRVATSREHGEPRSWASFAAVTPTVGLLIVFPGWLPHCVLPMRAHSGTKPRISLSFNAGVAATS